MLCRCGFCAVVDLVVDLQSIGFLLVDFSWWVVILMWLVVFGVRRWC